MGSVHLGVMELEWDRKILSKLFPTLLFRPCCSGMRSYGRSWRRGRRGSIFPSHSCARLLQIRLMSFCAGISAGWDNRTSVHWAPEEHFQEGIPLCIAGDEVQHRIVRERWSQITNLTDYSASGCWPSWAFHMHSVIFISVKTAVNDESSGEQAYIPKEMVSAPLYMWQIRIWLKFTPSVEHSMQ